jgi:hypothetical protein
VPLGAAAAKLRDQRLAVAVHDQARQPVGLAVHQPHAVAVDGQPRAQLDRSAQAPLEKRAVDALGLVEAPDAHADLGARRIRAPGQKAPVGALHPHGLAGIRLTALDRAIEHPRVVAQ